MALATLSIDLVAKLGDLQSGMDKASRIAEKSAAQIEARYKRMGDMARSVGAALGAAVSVAGLTAFVKTTIDGVAKLKEFRDATGASIENLSALEDIANRTGTSMDTAGKAVIKLNQALNTAKPGSNQAKAIEAIGLSVEKLQALDPAEALRQVAVAMARFAEDGEKARAAQILFGEEIRIIAPLLKNLGEQGEYVATVTTEQALAAEKFNNQLASLSKTATDAAREIAGPLVEALNQFFDAVSGKGVGGSSSITSAVVVPMQALAVIGANVAFVFRGVGNEIGGIAAQLKALASGDLEGFRAIGQLMKEDAEKARQEYEALYDRIMSIGRVLPQADYSNEGRATGRPSVAGFLGSIPPTGETRKPRGSATKDGIPYNLTGPMGPFLPELPPPTAAMIDALRAVEGTDLAKIERINASLDELFLLRNTGGNAVEGAKIDEAIFNLLEDLDKLGPVAEEAADRVVPAIAEISDFAQQASRNIQDALGNTIESALSGSFDSIEDLWKNMLRRMLAEATAAQIGKALFGAGLGTGGGIIGAIFTAATPLATGIDYVPRDNFPALLHRGERVVTAKDNAKGLGAPQIHYAPTINVNGDVSPQTIAAIRAEVQRDRSRWMRTMQAQGAL